MGTAAVRSGVPDRSQLSCFTFPRSVGVRERKRGAERGLALAHTCAQDCQSELEKPRVRPRGGQVPFAVSEFKDLKEKPVRPWARLGTLRQAGP